MLYISTHITPLHKSRPLPIIPSPLISYSHFFPSTISLLVSLFHVLFMCQGTNHDPSEPIHKRRYAM